MRHAFLLLPLLLVAACGDSSSHLSNRIMLDRSIGAVTLLETRPDVERALGRGMLTGSNVRIGTEVTYPKQGLEVAYAPGRSGTKVAFIILTTSRRYRTSGGVGVGSSRAGVEKLDGVNCYSADQCQHGAIGQGEPGTAFQFQNGRVWRVAIATDFG